MMQDSVNDTKFYIVCNNLYQLNSLIIQSISESFAFNIKEVHFSI